MGNRVKIDHSSPLKGHNIQQAIVAIEKRNNLSKDVKVNDDTIIRIELQGKIAQEVANGKSNREIINELSKDERYKKFKKYFEIWIENKRKIKRPNRFEELEKIIT